jgi:hypothetical protein
MNDHTFPHIIYPQPGHPRQASSYGRDPERGGTWCGTRPAPALRKRILLAPGETHTMADLHGPGIINRLFMTTLLPFNNHALHNLTLRFYWDNEAQPSVECPFGDFFGAPFGSYTSYISGPLSLTSRAFNSLWPMPYATSARLEVSNDGPAVVEPFFYHVGYTQLDEPLPSELRFHAQWTRQNPTQPGLPFTILEAQGKGHYVGCHLFMQNLEWWLRRPLSDIPFPLGFGMGMLEGWESIYVDGEQTPSTIGTGTEDFFGGAWYYVSDSKFQAPDHGCTLRDYLRGRIAAYRYDLDFPMSFERNIRVDLDHGFENQIRCDYTSIAYWYQEEPHRSFPPLPPVVGRKATSPLPNVLQAGLLLGGPALAGLALLWGLGKRLKR